MARAWVTNGKGIAGKVKNATQSSEYQIKDCGANLECPNCHHLIDNTDVSMDWPGLPVGVKFDPTDAELLEHLAGQVGLGNSKPQLFIDIFIPTLDEEAGICYTHPENLPGAKKDGSNIHFFHRTSKAYATGHRKRRKIHGQSSSRQEHVRWHKTGKTKPVMENGVQKGCKKIMVLYKSSKKGSKQDKSKWVMHQYHLGTEENEKEGELVVSKIFYQQTKQTDESDTNMVLEESVTGNVQTIPSTPASQTPNPPRPRKRALLNPVDEENVLDSSAQATTLIPAATSPPLAAVNLESEEAAGPSCWAGESQAIDDRDPNGLDASLLCDEILDSYAYNESGAKPDHYFSDFGHNRSDILEGDSAACGGISELNNLELETPPEFDLADLQFGSQDSIMSWLDRL